MNEPTELSFEATRKARRSARVDICVWGVCMLAVAGVIGFVSGDMMDASRPLGSNLSLVIMILFIALTTAFFLIWARDRLRFHIRFTSSGIVVGRGWTEYKFAYEDIAVVSCERGVGRIKKRVLIQSFRKSAHVLLAGQRDEFIEAVRGRCPNVTIIDESDRIFLPEHPANRDLMLSGMLAYHRRRAWINTMLLVLCIVCPVPRIVDLAQGEIHGMDFLGFLMFGVLPIIGIPMFLSSAWDQFGQMRRVMKELESSGRQGRDGT